MAAVRGSASFKKKDGTILLIGDAVTWSLNGASAPALTIPIPSIQNLQATPASNPKAMIKIIAAKDMAASSETETYTFTFTAGPDARSEADAMKEALSAAIQVVKASSMPGTPMPGGGGAATPGGNGAATGSSASMALTAAGSGPGTKAAGSSMWTSGSLLSDLDLQQTLLKADPELMKTFHATVVSRQITGDQFWSTRLHLLRAHAIEKRQRPGPYNVLATIKPKVVDNVSKMSLSREQIRDIFEQHPLVKTVYDENVPKLSEDQFWSRFFLSRLFKKLKGEKLLPQDAGDNVFDKYLTRDEEEHQRKRHKTDHVPLTIDLEGNEQNARRKGNAPDITMRPGKLDNVPIIRTLNSLSMKLLDKVPALDREGARSAEDIYLQDFGLADLRDDQEDTKIILKVRDQKRFFSEHEDASKNEFASLDAQNVLSSLCTDLKTQQSELSVLFPAEDPDEEMLDGPPSTSAFTTATSSIFAAVRERRLHLAPSSAQGLPPAIADQISLVHSTTHEFLHHFWSAFLSGDEARAKDINKLVTSLKNSQTRIEAIAKTAEEEREIEKAKKKKFLQEEFRRTNVRPKKKDLEVGGGREVVEKSLRPTLKAVEAALKRYADAVQEAERLLGSREGISVK